MTIVVLRRGDTLWAVARRFGTDVQTLTALNSLSEPARLVPGMALVVPSAETGARTECFVNAYAYPNLPLSSAREQLGYFSALCPFCWRFTAEGELLAIDDEPLLHAAQDTGTLSFLTVTNIDDSGGFSAALGHALLASETVQTQLLQRCLRLCRERGYAGVNFHFEYLYPFDRERYNAFLRRTSELLHAEGKYLSTAVAPKEGDEQSGALCAAHDYAAHGELCDWVVLMTYEWGHTYSPPRAVSPVDRIRAVLRYAVTTIPSGKILLGISNYGYNWRLPWKQGDAAAVIANTAALNLAAAVGSEIDYDPIAAAPHFRYIDTAGQRREVWFEDPRSFRARFSLVRDYALGGISYWTANNRNPAMLAVQESMLTAEKLF